jgi:hypothetical protein
MVTPSNDTAQAPKRDRYNRFAWRDDVFADTDASNRAKCLAFGLAQFINHETGEAKVGTRALAKACGNSQTWVTTTIPLLAATGWMQVLQKGRRGSGENCAGLYKMNRTREHTGCSLSDVLQATPREHFSPSREHPVCSEPLNHKSEPSARSSVYVDREETKTPVTIDAESGAYRALCLAHPEGLDPNTAIEERAIFDQLVKDGYDPEQLIEDAYDYGDTHRGIEVPSFRHWLLSKP